MNEFFFFNFDFKFNNFAQYLFIVHIHGYKKMSELCIILAYKYM